MSRLAPFAVHLFLLTIVPRFAGFFSSSLKKADRDEDIQYDLKTADTDDQGIAMGWEDIQYLAQGTVTKTYQDDTLPGGPHERTVEYVVPFFKPQREQDYRIAWAFFEHTDVS